MQIDPNARTNMVEGIATNPPPAARPLKKDAIASFHDAEILNQAIQKLDEVRNEEIERALNLVGQVQWPPGDTIRRIANLLAAKMGRPEE